MICNICPRECGVDRKEKMGFCKEGDVISVSKIMHHRWEEPCISGNSSSGGSGAIFFSGCPLHCVYCQNRDISCGGVGVKYGVKEFAERILSLQSEGVLNINFVTPTHFTCQIIEALEMIKESLKIPVIWNTSGYEKASTVKMLAPYVDIFLTDFKYVSAELAKRYSHSADYFEIASAALCEMVKITGAPVFEGELMKKGVIVRHLVLPGGYRDSIAVLDAVEACVGHENVVLSLMSQYTPEFLKEGYGELSRKITTFEYQKVSSHAVELGFDGYFQSRQSASPAFTPDFS